MNFIIEPISDLFKIILEYFFSFTHSWGWSIILLTVLIKMVLFPTTLKQIQAMNKMKLIQPKLKEIQEKYYKTNPEEYQRRTMELYKKENVNPFSGCLPLLIQIPILFAIFNLLQNPDYIANVIKDASFLGLFLLKDKGNIPLAILSGVTTFFQQKLTTPTATGNDQTQMMLYIMPVMFGFFTYQVNAGIGLYWVVSNVVGIAQQYLINEYFVVKEHLQHKDGEPSEETKKK
ncbi:MAG: YidC/Oxa1 family membrane protein insertase [Bacteroidota bacterium]